MKGNKFKLDEAQKMKIEQFYAYYNYVSDQRESFIVIMLKINKIINELKNQGEISDYVELRARIKSPKSAFKNDKNKALDDIFGMEVLAATEDELEVIKNKIEEYMVANKEECNKWDKPNGYKAEHRMLTLKKDKTALLGLENEEYENIPEIEFQFKTLEVAINAATGKASHSTYKQVDKEEIQRKYDNHQFSPYDIPAMWVSENGRMRALKMEEILRKMYPFLVMKKDKEKGEER